MFRPTTHRKQILQILDHVLRREGTGYLQGQTLSGVLIDHGQQLQRTAILRPIHQEVVRPDVIDLLGPVPNTAILTAARQTASTMLLSRHLEMFLLPQSMDTFVIHLPPFG
jgi:hypothetical protein